VPFLPFKPFHRFGIKIPGRSRADGNEAARPQEHRCTPRKFKDSLALHEMEGSMRGYAVELSNNRRGQSPYSAMEKPDASRKIDPGCALVILICQKKAMLRHINCQDVEALFGKGDCIASITAPDFKNFYPPPNAALIAVKQFD
jgi:hypothetical protein